MRQDVALRIGSKLVAGRSLRVAANQGALGKISSRFQPVAAQLPADVGDRNLDFTTVRDAHRDSSNSAQAAFQQLRIQATPEVVTRPREKKAQTEEEEQKRSGAERQIREGEMGKPILDCPGAGAAGDLVSKFSEENQ
jgi:hypothetical protein